MKNIGGGALICLPVKLRAGSPYREYGDNDLYQDNVCYDSIKAKAFVFHMRDSFDLGCLCFLFCSC